MATIMSSDFTIEGTSGSDLIMSSSQYGGYIFGNAGDDYIMGGPGEDWIYGGPGMDLMFGGAGEDAYVFQRNSGIDLVSDTGGFLVLDGIDINSLRSSLIGNHLLVTQPGTGNALLVADWLPNKYNWEMGTLTAVDTFTWIPGKLLSMLAAY